MLFKGRGAWKNWSYDMQIVNSQSGWSVFKKDIVSNGSVVDDLRPNTTYCITVHPSSSSSYGFNVNASFVGKTLPNNTQLRGIFWATDEAIEQTTPLGQDVQTLANIRSFQVNTSPQSFDFT